mmetsp:Transcript_19324/g.57415  ORF Transcript_19324/g.57415 Transcript_19324/m.57415 type:complete len:184 (-) Transcript_19324:87-638(-)|eukprot:CAMPEP_0119259800 /NCGR_PEP_ID=MMETSP1329-20130426/471_1 /TAXON_ID=114041 /ORGANISM="Genus nov. species nov., Strain RCC1024" /LENGTH=183 /DNA_ID=CAMNT_0007259201 /DNA_START=166 /DNA_END=717 /DNA_ORIENTATION=-
MRRGFMLAALLASVAGMNVHDCEDLAAWKEDEQKDWVMLTAKKGCDWIGEEPEKRCSMRGKVTASEACRATCGTGGVDQASFQILPENAQRANTLGVGAIEAQPFLFQTLKTTLHALRAQAPRDCAWVGQENTAMRCKEKGSIPAIDACHEVCYREKRGIFAREGVHTRAEAQTMRLRGSARA